MKGAGLIAVVLALIIPFFFLLMWVVGTYNRLVALRNRLKDAFGQIDVQLKRRYDLIPNLVDAAKPFLQHERSALEALMNARNVAVSAHARAAQSSGDPAAMKELSDAETALSGSLTRLLVLAESQPNPKANTTITALIEQLTSTENNLASARQAYNDAATNYNTSLGTFPSNLIAAAFNFSPAAPFRL